MCCFLLQVHCCHPTKKKFSMALKLQTIMFLRYIFYVIKCKDPVFYLKLFCIYNMTALHLLGEIFHVYIAKLSSSLREKINAKT